MAKGLVLLLVSAVFCHAQQGQRDIRVAPITRVNPLQDSGTRWAVIVGISAYEHLPPAAQLRFAHRDAERFASFLRTTAGGAIPGDHIRLLTGTQATLANVRSALYTWLPASAGPRDIVYFYFAGHGVLDDQDEGYFVTHDADPQNLHATALAFQEVDEALSRRVPSNLVVMITDACHAGQLGWSTFQPAARSRAAEPLSRIGQGDRSFLKLMASRPSEPSFEDEKLDGGHGVFTHVLLEGLTGQADGDGDRVVRAAEVIDYVSRRVPDLTSAQQHPRVAGTFDARVALATSELPLPPPRAFPLDISGPSGAAIYLDNTFRGSIRAVGALRVDSLAPGPHAFSADFPDGTNITGAVTLPEAPARLALTAPAASALEQLRRRIHTDAAWAFYRNQSFTPPERVAADALMAAALEEAGQACVGDYVQSTATGLKRAMLERAVDAFAKLQTLRPNDPTVETRRLFCQGRLLIADTRFTEAAVVLQQAIQRDARFACAYNAIGVALSRLGRPQEARQAFETAAKLTPEWGLPPFQLAQQFVNAGQPAKAVPYLEKAVAFSPRSVPNRWNLAHVLLLAGDSARGEKEAQELIRLAPNYAPGYLELGRASELQGKRTQAADAYQTYADLAPNFAGTDAVRARATALRARPVTPAR